MPRVGEKKTYIAGHLLSTLTNLCDANVCTSAKEDNHSWI